MHRSTDQPIHHAAASRGFTLVELLVVIAIIVTLLALLIPSMNRSIELAQRTVCLAQMHGTVVGALSYAGSHFGMLPPAQNADRSVWTCSFDLRVHNTPTAGPLALGLAVATGAISPANGSLFHCPSMDTAGSVAPYHSMNANTPNGWNGVGMNWWGDPAYSTKRIVVGYSYRSASWYRYFAGRQMTISGFSRPEVLYADMLDTRFGVRFTHRTGYNQVANDGSGGWFNDPKLTIEAATFALGAGYPNIDGNSSLPAVDEQAFGMLLGR